MGAEVIAQSYAIQIQAVRNNLPLTGHYSEQLPHGIATGAAGNSTDPRYGLDYSPYVIVFIAISLRNRPWFMA